MTRLETEPSLRIIDLRGLFAEIYLLPNLITLIRIILIIPIFLFYNSPSPTVRWAVFALLAISYLSDYLDGFAARRLKLQSRLGLLLDPIADKLWTVTMVYLLIRYRSLPFWIGTVIIIRDLLILALNGWIIRQGLSVHSSDEMGRKYMVLLGLLVLAMTIKTPKAVWLAYVLVLLAPIVVVRYVMRFQKVLSGLRKVGG